MNLIYPFLKEISSTNMMFLLIHTAIYSVYSYISARRRAFLLIFALWKNVWKVFLILKVLIYLIYDMSMKVPDLRQRFKHVISKREKFSRLSVLARLIAVDWWCFSLFKIMYLSNWKCFYVDWWWISAGFKGCSLAFELLAPCA